jgi:DNA-directed DNA polymerase III PolC
MSGFVPLRVRSHGSLLLGTAAPEALIGRALESGYGALALTDRDNLYLAVRFYRAARAEGLVPLLGAEVTAGGGEPGLSALLLPLDRRGYANLCRILTARHLDPGFDLAGTIAEHPAGLHVIVESVGLALALRRAGVPAAAGADAESRGLAHRAGGLWMGVRGLAAERAGLSGRVTFARRLGLPLVATGDAALLHPRDFDTHRVAVTAAAGELLERMPADAFCAREAWLASPPEWERRVRALCAGAGVPEAGGECLANNAALAARCRLELELGTPIFPRAPLGAPGEARSGETGPGRLLRLTREGLRRRYGRDHRPALARLREELGIIDRLGFTDYFLLVAEIVGFARERGIPTVGRGSGAGSIVAYVLGITNVDPLRYGLYFERFLHPSRRDCPDLDIDLCWKRRDEVIAHVYATYGADRVAMISTHATLGARSAFRETAKALGVSNARVNALARRIPRELEAPYLERLGAVVDARGVDWREPVLAEALRLAERLDGSPRHLSVHCGGIVIADRPLTWYLPLERAAKDVVVTQFEMRAIEAIGLVKMDLLGNRALTTIGDCIELARRRGARDGGPGAEVELDAIPGEDAATAARIAAGDTLNCFQLESPAMRHLLRMLRCSTLAETIAAVALIRPGAAESGMKEVFCRRHRGLEPASFAHPRLEAVLGETHGVMLYEEDVMRVAAALTGLSLAQGDELRRAISAARGEEEFRSLEHGFVQLATAHGAEPGQARDVWRDLTRFAAYAFCKAHAAGYGTLGWQCAWLKARFPTEYAVGVLNHHAGMYPTWVHVEDLRRHGVEFRAPCVNRSEWDTTLEVAEGEHSAVRIGLARVAGLAAATGTRIVAARAGRPYRSLADLAARTHPTLPELEALILAGALDATGRTRPSLLLEARVAHGVGARRRAGAGAARELVAPDGALLLPEAAPPMDLPVLPEFAPAERVRGECRSVGLWFSAHPLDVFVPPEALRGVTLAAALAGPGQAAGRRVAVAGLPCAWRRVETRGGGTMLFLTLADRSGLAECALFPDAYRALAGTLRGEVVRVEGRLDETLGAVTLVVDRAKTLS